MRLRKKSLSFLLLCVLLLMGHRGFAEIGEIYVTVTPDPHARHAPKDGSTLWLKTGLRITSLLVGSQGRKTGIDPETFKVLQEIPGSACEVEFSPNPYTGDDHAEAREQITLIPARKGIYQLILKGLQSGPFTIEAHSLSLEGSSLPDKNLEGVITDGEEKILKMAFDPAPHSEISFLAVTP